MESILYLGLTRQIGLRRQLDVIANNIANANTDGFRADRLAFSQVLAQPDEKRAERFAFSSGANIAPDSTPGPVNVTGNPLDIAIQGDGYFAVRSENDEARYTRNGRLTFNDRNELITNNGDRILDVFQNVVTLPLRYERIDITSDGLLLVDNEQIAQLGVFNFERPHELEKIGAALYKASEEPELVDPPALTQGAIESSNVQAIGELIKMLQVEKDYKSSQKMIDLNNKRVDQAIDVFTRV